MPRPIRSGVGGMSSNLERLALKKVTQAISCPPLFCCRCSTDMRLRVCQHWPSRVPAERLVCCCIVVRTRQRFIPTRAGGGATHPLRKWASLSEGSEGATVHGFRCSGRHSVIWCAETGRPRGLAEVALAHAVGDQTQRAYSRSCPRSPPPDDGSLGRLLLPAALRRH